VAYLIMSFFATFPYRITLFVLCGLVAATVKLIEFKKSPEVSEPYRIFSFLDLRNIILLEIGIIALWHLIIKYGHLRM